MQYYQEYSKKWQLHQQVLPWVRYPVENEFKQCSRIAGWLQIWRVLQRHLGICSKSRANSLCRDIVWLQLKNEASIYLTHMSDEYERDMANRKLLILRWELITLIEKEARYKLIDVCLESIGMVLLGNQDLWLCLKRSRTTVNMGSRKFFEFANTFITSFQLSSLSPSRVMHCWKGKVSINLFYTVAVPYWC